MKGKKIFSFIEVDENTPLQKLSVPDQIRALIKAWSKDDASELQAQDAVTVHLLQLQANLQGFVDNALVPIREGRKHSVTMLLSNKFDPVFDIVFSEDTLLKYYTLTVNRPDIDFDIEYFIEVKLTLKD